MNASVTFACVLRSGGVYSPEWMERLSRQVHEHLKPDRIVCLTDKTLGVYGVMPPSDNWTIYALAHNWPGWFSKLELFRPGLFTGRVVYADLDSLLLAPIDFAPVWAALEKGPQRLACLSDFYNPRIAASGVMAWLPGPETERIYRAFAAQPEISYRWDRGDGYHIGRHPHLRLQTLLPGAFGSYKADKLQAGPRGFAHVSFHGVPKNNSFPPDHWVSRCWVGANDQGQQLWGLKTMTPLPPCDHDECPPTHCVHAPRSCAEPPGSAVRSSFANDPVEMKLGRLRIVAGKKLPRVHVDDVVLYDDIAAALTELSRLRAGLEKIVEGGYAPGSDVAHPAIRLARDTLDPEWREKAQRRAESHYPQNSPAQERRAGDSKS